MIPGLCKYPCGFIFISDPYKTSLSSHDRLRTSTVGCYQKFFPISPKVIMIYGKRHVYLAGRDIPEMKCYRSNRCLPRNANACIYQCSQKEQFSHELCF